MRRHILVGAGQLGPGEMRNAVQRSGFGQDPGSDALFEHVRGGNVDGYRQEGFGLATKGNEIEERPAGLEIDQQIEIPRSFGVANGEPKTRRLRTPKSRAVACSWPAGAR